MRGQIKVAALQQMTDNKQDNLQISRSLNVGSIVKIVPDRTPHGLMETVFDILYNRKLFFFI